MYVALGVPKGYKQVTIREDVYNPATGGKKTKIIRKVGKLSDLLAETRTILLSSGRKSAWRPWHARKLRNQSFLH